MKTRIAVAFAALALAAAWPALLHAQCAPDPTTAVLVDADIYDVSGGDLVTVLASPFPDDSLVGAWIAVLPVIDQPLEYFQIIANWHTTQNNISVFTVAEDLESAGGSDWWLYFELSTFDIVGNSCSAPVGAEQPEVAASSWGAVKRLFR